MYLPLVYNYLFDNLSTIKNVIHNTPEIVCKCAQMTAKVACTVRSGLAKISVPFHWKLNFALSHTRSAC